MRPPVPPRSFAGLLDDFAQWMTQKRGLSPQTIQNRRWHVENLDRCKHLIEEHAVKIAERVGHYTSDCVPAEYLYLLDADPEIPAQYTWHALAFNAAKSR